MCAARWPKLICWGVGLKPYLSAGISSSAATVSFSRPGSICRSTSETGLLDCCASAAPEKACEKANTQTTTQNFMLPPIQAQRINRVLLSHNRTIENCRPEFSPILATKISARRVAARRRITRTQNTRITTWGTRVRDVPISDFLRPRSRPADGQLSRHLKLGFFPNRVEEQAPHAQDEDRRRKEADCHANAFESAHRLPHIGNVSVQRKKIAADCAPESQTGFQPKNDRRENHSGGAPLALPLRIVGHIARGRPQQRNG